MNKNKGMTIKELFNQLQEIIKSVDEDTICCLVYEDACRTIHSPLYSIRVQERNGIKQISFVDEWETY